MRTTILLLFLSIVVIDANANEQVKLHRNFAEMGDALCISGYDEMPIVYRCDDPRSLRFFGIYDGKDSEGQDSAITEGVAVAKINNKGWPVEIDDLLTTSGNEGHLMRQKDNITKMETVARVVANVDFDTEGEGLGSQKALIEIVRYDQSSQ